ncbi:ureidoglycine aminohydrolase [Perilla frutescens var. frutescens]|nr:ureidoglycine aminohydrolase [Perilla frutescens var. frutescens]
MFESWVDQGTKCKSRKESQQNEKTDDEANCFDKLPYETVVDIVSRLPITSLIQFSFVSRSSNSLCQDPHVVNTHLLRSSIKGSSCLILHSDYPIQNQLHFLQLCDGKLRKIDTPFASRMPEFSILGSSNGLLCLINTLFPESIYLYNPFTRDHVELARNLDFQGQIVVYGYGFSPVTNDYKVIKIAYYTRGFRHESEVQIFSLRCNVWESRDMVPYRLEKWSSPGVVVSGRVHWVSRSRRSNGRDERKIVSCDLADDSFHVVKQPGSFCDPYGRWVSCHLAALDGCLCASIPAARGLGTFDVWIMKEYGVNESWMKAYSIGVYYPVSMISHQMERSSHIWRNMFSKKRVQILCVLESGELLLEYRGGGLVLYDIFLENFKELKLPGMPRLYQTTVHVGVVKISFCQEGFCSAPSILEKQPLYWKATNPTLSPSHLQDLPGFTRSVYKRDHALITPESHVFSPLPEWSNTLGAYLITPSMGSHFAMYLAKMQENSNSGLPPKDVERFVFVLQGVVILTDTLGVKHGLQVDSYAYLPPNSKHSLNSDASATLVVLERRYEYLEDHTTGQIISSTSDQPLLETPGEVFELRKLLPTSLPYDFNIHIMDFQPGEFLNVKEVHYNQHGLLLLEGQGIYRLGDSWYPVQAGDAIWMAPFVPQWYAALGKAKSRYLLYKDVNRNPL